MRTNAVGFPVTSPQKTRESIVVLPGWFVKYTGRGPVRVMNCKYLTKYLRNEPEKIPPAQVRRIITALEDQCRTIDFS